MLLLSIAETEMSIHQSAQTSNIARIIRVHSHLIFFMFAILSVHFILIHLSFSCDICLNVLDGFFSIPFDIPSDAFFGIHVYILAGIP